MSTVFLHVGQCGNQLGQSFWQEVAGWYSPTSRPPRAAGPTPPTSKHHSSKRETHHTKSLAHLSIPYSLLDGTIPSVLVDTEPKVIRKCTGEGTVLGRGVPPHFRVVERRGRGSNWAYGYYAATRNTLESGRRTGGSVFGLCEEKSLVDTVQEHIRTLVEKCDRFGGFVQLHSIAGGTGSGVGSATIEQLREDYPLSYILSIPVTPFSYGETPLQYYNSLLCLKSLQAHADGILLFQNDHVLTQAEKYLSKSTSAPHDGRLGSAGYVAVEEMNRHISQTLCNALLPIWSAKQKFPPLSGPEPWELIRSLCPDPSLKFISPTHAHLTKATDTWDSAFSSITTSLRTVVPPRLLGEAGSLPGSVPAKPPTTALVVICRACPAATDSFISRASVIERRLKQTYNTVSWNPFPVDMWSSYEPQLRERKVVSVLANSAMVRSYMESVVVKAQRMYQERAYLHWFEKYGCERDTFKEAFQVVQGVVDNYRSL